MFLVPCCDIRYDFCTKTISRLPFALYQVHVLFMVFAYIYVYWCPSRFPYQMMFVLFISNTAGVTCRAGYPFRSTWVHHKFLVGFVLLELWFLVKCFVYCCLSFLLLVIVLPVLLRFTTSDYNFGIFKLFLESWLQQLHGRLLELFEISVLNGNDIF